MGGIGFFLGGIGPDGHIAFNVRGSSIYSVTRLTGTNYETQAAAATDLGGIEISRSRLVITIGLATITLQPDRDGHHHRCGRREGADRGGGGSEHEMAPPYPASVLQELPNARLYLTKGAASRLVERRFEDFSGKHAGRGRRASTTRGRRWRWPVRQAAPRADRGGFPGRPVRAAAACRRPGRIPATSRRRRASGSWRRSSAGWGTCRTRCSSTRSRTTTTSCSATWPTSTIWCATPRTTTISANLTSGFTAVSNPYCLTVMSEAGAVHSIRRSSSPC